MAAIDKATGYAMVGREFEHRLIAEKALGRPLAIRHPVHHINHIKSDNRNQNLVICENKAYHHLLHANQRIVDLGGDPQQQKICHTCGLRPRMNFSKNRSTYDGLCKVCKACDSARRIGRIGRKMNDVQRSRKREYDHARYQARKLA